MINNRGISVISLSLLMIGNSYAKENHEYPTQEISPIEVRDSRYNAVFKNPRASSYREEDILGQDMDTIIRGIPGTFTQHDIGQGGFTVNIRGLEGNGRVNTTIDGVSQTFFQTNPAHGWNGYTTYVDSNFIAGVSTDRGSVAGVSGVNALAGAVEFRTIDVSDIVDKQNHFGARSVIRSGSNGYGTNGMQALAYQHDLDNGGKIGFLSAFAFKNKYGYKNGAGETIASSDYDGLTQMESGVKSLSGLLKLQYKPNRYHDITLTRMLNYSRFINNHNPMKVTTQTSLMKYRYNPLSDLIDIRTDIAYTIGKQEFLNRKYTSYSLLGRKTHNPTFSLSLQNTSIIDFENSVLTFQYGGKILNARYKGDEQDMMLVTGRQTIRALFTDINWHRKKWNITLGASYERYGMHGYLPPTDDDGALVLPKGGDVYFGQKETHFNPRLNIAYNVTDWLQLYANIGKSSRTPNVQEFMYANNTSDNPYSINPYLRGETSFNRDIGFNIQYAGLFRNSDLLNLKVNYFNNTVKNYILQEQFYICQGVQLYRCDLDTYMNLGAGKAYDTVGIYLNIPGKTHMRGWEIEGSYDMGRLYTKLSVSKTKTDFPHDYLSDMGFSHIRTLPSLVWTIDIGTRWFNNKLMVGTRISYTGKDQVAGGIDLNTNKQYTEIVNANPKIIDVYAIYQAKKNLYLFLNIDNVTNRVFNYPLSGGTLGTGNLGGSAGAKEGDWANKGTGRGRTIYGGISWQF